MKILNFGSINIDHVYRVVNFVKSGRTIHCKSYKTFAGGKGSNQSIALARAGAQVYHAGLLCVHDKWVKEMLDSNGVDTSLIELVDSESGHAIIQVDKKGHNSKVIYGGANHEMSVEQIDKAISMFSRDDYLLVQNEINLVDEVIKRGKNAGMKVVFNPAPINSDVFDYPLRLVDILILNRLEAEELTDKCKPGKILKVLAKQYPNMAVVLNLGEDGAIYTDSVVRVKVDTEQEEAVDKTGASDTFIGYFLANFMRGEDINSCLQLACKAASVCMRYEGAADSIPRQEEAAEEAVVIPGLF